MWSDEAQSDEMTQKYHELLSKIANNNYKCRLCLKDNELPFDDDKVALHHITKSHSDMGYGCECGWYVNSILCDGLEYMLTYLAIVGTPFGTCVT